MSRGFVVDPTMDDYNLEDCISIQLEQTRALMQQIYVAQVEGKVEISLIHSFQIAQRQIEDLNALWDALQGEGREPAIRKENRADTQQNPSDTLRTIS